MQVTLLGTGTSHGIPVVNCNCEVCRSEVKENKRSRCSVYIREGDTAILIDTATEFRLQAVKTGIHRLDAVLYTHSHADHLHGLDDIRPFTVNREIPVYAREDVCNDIRARFPYIFNPLQKGGGTPKISLHTIGTESFTLGKMKVIPIPVFHGILAILGFRIGDFAYITDCSRIPETSWPLLEGLSHLVLGAPRFKPHETHFCIPEALEVIKKISPERAYLTHICHEVDHFQLKRDLKDLNVEPAYDGQVFNLTL